MAVEMFRKHVVLSERDLAKLLGLDEVDDARVWLEEGGRYVHLVASVDELSALQASWHGWSDRQAPEVMVPISSSPASVNRWADRQPLDDGGDPAMTELTEPEPEPEPEVTTPPDWMVVSRLPSAGIRLIEADEVGWTDDRIPTLFKLDGETVAAVAPGSWSFIGQVPRVGEDSFDDMRKRLAASTRAAQEGSH